MKRIFSIFALFAATSIFATTRPCPGDYSLKGEWLYLAPLLDSPFYVIDDTNTTDDIVGKRKANELDFHSGYRIEGMFAFCNDYYDMKITWTQLWASASDTSTDDSTTPMLLLTIGYPRSGSSSPADFASIDTHLTYYRLEAVLGHKLFDCCCSALTIETGIQYARIAYHQKLDANKPSPPRIIHLDSKSTFWGIGPQAGLDLNYTFCNGLTITGNVNGAMLVSKNETKWFADMIQNGDQTIVDIHNEDIWRIIPSSEMRVGLNYQCCLCCINWNIEAGYHVVSYYKAIDSIRFMRGISNGLSFDNYSNASMHGPFASLSLTF